MMREDCEGSEIADEIYRTYAKSVFFGDFVVNKFAREYVHYKYAYLLANLLPKNPSKNPSFA